MTKGWQANVPNSYACIYFVFSNSAKHDCVLNGEMGESHRKTLLVVDCLILLSQTSTIIVESGGPIHIRRFADPAQNGRFG